MKKLLICLVLAMAAGFCCLAALGANTFTEGEWEYAYLGDSTIEIVSYKGSAESVSVPATLANLDVVSVGKRAFSGNGQARGR